MMFSIRLSLTVALCLLMAYNVNALNAVELELKMLKFSWQACGPSSDIIQVKSLSVTPDPIKLPGNISIDTSFSAGASTATDLALAVTMEKKVAGFYVKIPCVDNVGSCTYGNICNIWAQACPSQFEKYGLPCNCPFPAKTYTVSDVGVAITVNLPGIVDGEYRITGNLVSSSAGHIGCLQVIVNLSK